MAQNDKNSQTDLDGLEKMGMPDGQPRPIACLPIIGQIEGHMALSDSSKTTKYEHILPMLVDIEQNDKVQGHQRAAVGGLSQGDAGAGGAVCLRSFRHEGKALP